MTRRQRLIAVLEGRKPDTVPIFLRGVSPFGEKMNWMGKHQPSYERLRGLALEETEIFHGVGFDSGVFLSGADIDVSESIIREDEEWRDVERRIETPLGPLASVTRHSRSNNYDVMQVEFYVKSEEDVERFLSLPYEPVRPEVKPVMKAKDAEVGESGVVSVGIPSAMGVAYGLWGSQRLALWSVMHREKVVRVLEVFRDRVVEYVEHLLKGWAGPVLASGGAELATPPLMSPGDFHDFVTEMDKPVNDIIHSYGCHSWVHCHGNLDRVLEDFVEAGVDVIEPVEAPPGGDVELADAKRRVGDKLVLMGNMPYEAIISWPKERIEARVRADCEAAMEGGGFIMMPCASPFEPELTDEGYEGYKTYVRAGRKHGRYD